MFTINIYAEDHGWLFEDLKQHFRNLKRVNDIEILVSERPLVQVDAWVALRTKEAVASPDIRRTVVCVHDLLCDGDMYQQGGSRQGVREAGALVLCHPEQRRILSEAGVSLQKDRILERPLGALTYFTPRESYPDLFTVGWVGRNHSRKRLEWFVQTIQQLSGPTRFRVSLIGSGLEDAAAELGARDVDCRVYDKDANSISSYPQLYQGLDCLVITSSTEAGPITLFEALATGVPVVSTPVGWAPYFSDRAPRYVRLGACSEELAVYLEDLRNEREVIFQQRFEITKLVSGWTLDSWLLEVISLAGTLVSNSLQKSR